MTTNLTRAVEREVHIAYAHGKDAGSPTGSLPTEDQVVEVATDRIAQIVQQWVLSKEGMTLSAMMGYEAGVKSRPVQTWTGGGTYRENGDE